MITLNLQFFGNGKSGGEGRQLMGKSGGPGLNQNDIVQETDVWSYRHRKENEPFVDHINSSIYDITDDFPDVMRETVATVSASQLKGMAAAFVLGYWDNEGGLALNQNYTDISKMNAVYDEAVKSGYHPSRGGKSGTQAVTYHEMGHALTYHVGVKHGIYNIDDAAKRIVDNAYRSTAKGSRTRTADTAWAGQISGYAKENYAECVAEAVSDYYCNGSKASTNSKAIMAELKRMQG